MSLIDWEQNGWVKKHTTSRAEISNLFGIIDRDLLDAKEEDISNDWQFGIAYNAALKLCTVLLYANGYRATGNLHHYRTIQAVPLILGDSARELCDYLETCRKKRNTIEYDYAGAITHQDAMELISSAEELKSIVVEYLANRHPELLNG